ncbi:MAG: 5-(carboxyamino)imidazole ribonucleotide mutase [Chitinophagales bacterium]|nr:5-(carboxyamino)imidazole ribonucleotide mutase [Chitinophagales bacterium]MDW8274425.1 5-(carboxyamino)imidazole ribonucleotide mutase [Chitinophagales bacterium]
MNINESNRPIVGIVMGSHSDLKVMQEAADMLGKFNVPYELTVVSAHRTPQRLMKYASDAASRGLKVIIAGAGGAAHLPGMIASVTTLPVVGVPIKSSNSIDGWDSVLSILQMPAGVPVATVALDGAKNAAILALQILATSDDALASQLILFKKELSDKVLDTVRELKIAGYRNEYDV